MRLGQCERKALLLEAEKIVYGYFEREEVRFIGDLVQKDRSWAELNGPKMNNWIEHLNGVLVTLVGLPLGSRLDELTMEAYQIARGNVLRGVPAEEAWPTWYIRCFTTSLDCHR